MSAKDVSQDKDVVIYQLSTSEKESAGSLGLTAWDIQQVSHIIHPQIFKDPTISWLVHQLVVICMLCHLLCILTFLNVNEWSVWMMEFLLKIETESKYFVSWFAYTVKFGYGKSKGPVDLLCYNLCVNRYSHITNL